MYRANEGSLKTAESGEMELPSERTRGFWKLSNPGRPICVPGKQGDLETAGTGETVRVQGGRESEKPENS